MVLLDSSELLVNFCRYLWICLWLLLFFVLLYLIFFGFFFNFSVTVLIFWLKLGKNPQNQYIVVVNSCSFLVVFGYIFQSILISIFMFALIPSLLMIWLKNFISCFANQHFLKLMVHLVFCNCLIIISKSRIYFYIVWLNTKMSFRYILAQPTAYKLYILTFKTFLSILKNSQSLIGNVNAVSGINFWLSFTW